MDFDSAKKQFKRLSRLFHAGRINQDEFIRGVDGLAIEDDQGFEWQIGMQTGRWYRKDGDRWVEDDPPLANAGPPYFLKTRRRKNLRRGLLAGLMLFVLIALLYGKQWIGSNGEFSSRNFEGLETDAPGSIAQSSQTTSTLAVNDQSQDGESADSDHNGMSSPTPTSAQPQGFTPTPFPSTVLPSSTPTLPPPPSKFPPQILEEKTSLNIGEELMLREDWNKLFETLSEDEILDYQGKTAILLQYTENSALWPVENKEFADIERRVTLAMPREEGNVSILCRWDSKSQSGYALRFSQQDWALEKYLNGINIVLADGSQTVNFKAGGYETFSLSCMGGDLSVWNGYRRIAAVTDDRFPQGEYGLLFSVDDGVGVVIIAEDKVWFRLDAGTAAGKNDIVRLGALDVQYKGVLGEYAQLPSDPYSGQPLIGMEIRIANGDDQPIQIDAENIYLQNGEQIIHALSNPPQSVSGVVMPFTLKNAEKTGEFFFVGVNLTQLKEWQLVVDLRYEGYGEARFDLSE